MGQHDIFDIFLLIDPGYTGYPPIIRARNHGRQLVTHGFQTSEKQQGC